MRLGGEGAARSKLMETGQRERRKKAESWLNLTVAKLVEAGRTWSSSCGSHWLRVAPACRNISSGEGASPCDG